MLSNTTLIATRGSSLRDYALPTATRVTSVHRYDHQAGDFVN